VQEQVSDRLVGTLVDNRYAVRSKLARGGMSTVYLATDLRLERDVALKVLHPHLATDETFLDRLGREAKAAAKLSDAHVVGVLDQGNDGQTAYLVMEHIKGHTLRDVIRSKGALPPRLALALIDPVVQGLGAAHAAGLIHRDVKPENVLIADDGRIKIGDFGLARAVTTSTSTGTLIGTVGYLSPELVLGKQADTRSDIYSVGIMLYEMLTGQQPYDGDVPIQVAYKHVNETVGPPSALVPGLAAEVDELVQWCTAKDPENRPVDGNALLQELRHIRTNLTDAELDLRPPAAAPEGQQNPTEIIARTNNPTAVMSSFSRPQPQHLPHAPHALYPPDADYRPGEQYRPEAQYRPDARDAVPAAIPLSKRARRKLDREDEKARSRAAATPVRSLREGNPRRRGVLWVVVLVIIALLATGAGWFFGMGPGSPGTIPAVASKSVAQAQQLLSEAGFQSRTNDVFDDDVPSGLVVGSDPTAGTEARKFQPVSLFVSKGPQLFELPKLTGRTLDDTKNALNQAEMALGTVTEQFDETIAVGVVLSQDPAAATPARHGTPVNLLVSKGPQPIPVPSVVGLEENAAVDAIEAAGLKADVAKDEVNDPKVPQGSVAAQSPATGTLTKGGTVTLTISDGPKLVKVPSFVGKQAAEARRVLEGLGFKVEVENVLGGFFGTVREQTPDDGEIPEGSVIKLRVV
jgi:serine/threonine protein kinase/beta-lactam-binding protein with PASTA domain